MTGRFAVFVVSLTTLICSSAFGQSNLPSKLSGKWSIPSGRVSNEMSLKFDETRTKATLTVWSASSDCNIKDAPATVEVKGDKVLIVVDPAYSNLCRRDISLELTKSTDSDAYEGELRQGGQAANSFPVLKVKVSP